MRREWALAELRQGEPRMMNTVGRRLAAVWWEKIGQWEWMVQPHGASHAFGGDAPTLKAAIAAAEEAMPCRVTIAHIDGCTMVAGFDKDTAPQQSLLPSTIFASR